MISRPQESRERQAADLAPDGLLVAGTSGRLEFVSLPAARMLETTVQEATGRELGTVLRLVDQDGRDWISTNRPYAGLSTRSGVPEQPWLLPDGTEVLVAARLHRAVRPGPVTQVAISLRSGRGRARLDRERSDLVAVVAHELRSPLTGVKGFVQVLLNRWDRLADEQKKLMLATVKADADRLSRLITELLDVARLDTGRLQLFARPCDAELLIGRVVTSVVAGTARSIELEVESGLPEVQADPDKLAQVVTNLVENAVQHGDGPVTVRVAEAEQQGMVRILVEDHGTGIAPELRAQVLTKFWTHRSGSGSGLGLYLAQGLAVAHGGSLRIGERPGGGARIELLWPCVVPPQES